MRKWLLLVIPTRSIPWLVLAWRLLLGPRWRRGERVCLASLAGASGIVVDLVRPRPWLRHNDPDAAAALSCPVGWWERWPLVRIASGADCAGSVLLVAPDGLTPHVSH